MGLRQDQNEPKLFWIAYTFGELNEFYFDYWGVWAKNRDEAEERLMKQVFHDIPKERLRDDDNEDGFWLYTIGTNEPKMGTRKGVLF